MRSLAASLLGSQGMLCNVTEPETLGYEGGVPSQSIGELTKGPQLAPRFSDVSVTLYLAAERPHQSFSGQD